MRPTVFSLALALGVLGSVAALALPPQPFQGRPVFARGTHLGGFVWHNADGLHVRFTTKGKKRAFSGKMCTTKKMHNLKHFRLEKQDTAEIGPKEHCVHFDFKVKGGMDGFDVKTTGGDVTFDFKMDGVPLDTDKIYVGRNGVHPKNNPFVLNRPKQR